MLVRPSTRSQPPYPPMTMRTCFTLLPTSINCVIVASFFRVRVFKSFGVRSGGSFLVDPCALFIHFVLFFSFASFSFVPSLFLLSFSFLLLSCPSTRAQNSISSYGNVLTLLAIVVFFQVRHAIHEMLFFSCTSLILLWIRVLFVPFDTAAVVRLSDLDCSSRRVGFYLILYLFVYFRLFLYQNNTHPRLIRVKYIVRTLFRLSHARLFFCVPGW